VWSYDDFMVVSERQAEYYKENVGAVLPLPSRGGISRATVTVSPDYPNYYLQCHLDMESPRFIVARSSKVYVNHTAG